MPMINCPEGMRAYQFHGLKFSMSGPDQAVAECPLCGRDKWYCNTKTGLFDCKTCTPEGGNILTFVRKIWDMSDKDTPNADLEALRKERKLLYLETLEHWGVAKSKLNGRWLVPGYNASKAITQVYQYCFIHSEKRWAWLPTPGLTPGHGLLGVNLFDPKLDVVYICEGLWDGAAFFEMVRPSGKSNVVAVPSANVFLDSWTHLFSKKEVVLMGQSDHPVMVNGADRGRASYKGMERASWRLKDAGAVYFLVWGQDGYDPKKKSGYDLRDHLSSGGDTFDSRLPKLSELVNMIQPIPEEWKAKQKKSHSWEFPPCQEWNELVNKWHLAMEFTEGLDLALSVILACVAATMTPEDQLWIKMVGPPSCGKSVLCEALAKNEEFVHAESTITGLHSGYKTDKHGEEDYSLIVKIIGKTLVVKDGDTILRAANRDKILSELRDAYDGSARVHYLHGIARSYKDFRFGLVLAGTESLRMLDSSELGERFVDVEIPSMDDETEDRIGIRSANDMIHVISNNGTASKKNDATEKAEAKELTAGYINYLRTNAEKLFAGVSVPTEHVKRLQVLGKFVAFMRSRPSKTQDEKAQRELSFRLIKQLSKLAMSLAVVMNRKVVDEEVMKRVATCAMSTARGASFEICKLLYAKGEEGYDISSINYYTNQKEETTKEICRFLRRIHAVEMFAPPHQRVNLRAQQKYRLTYKVKRIFKEVYDAAHKPLPDNAEPTPPSQPVEDRSYEPSEEQQPTPEEQQPADEPRPSFFD